jgi:isopentenyl phosphate kinase
MLVLKLGGSVITDKRVRCKARPDIVGRLARELKPFCGEMVIVHGAGSFGHILASKYGLKEGISSDRALLGAAQVQREVRELDSLVCHGLQKAGIPAVSIPPSVFLRFSCGSLSEYDVQPFKDAMTRGFVPVTFGDVVLDDHQGIAICSGDDLMKLLASEFKAERAIFVSDVDGIYDADPKKDKKAKLAREIDPLRPFKAAKSASNVEDVTGAMAGKLEAALDIAALGAEVYVVNGLAAGRLSALLRGRKGIWTRIGGMR